MDFAFSEQQDELRQGVRLVLDAECTPDALRDFALADVAGRSELASNRWAVLAELGAPALVVPEAVRGPRPERCRPRRRTRGSRLRLPARAPARDRRARRRRPWPHCSPIRPRLPRWPPWWRTTPRRRWRRRRHGRRPHVPQRGVGRRHVAHAAGRRRTRRGDLAARVPRRRVGLATARGAGGVVHGRPHARAERGPCLADRALAALLGHVAGLRRDGRGGRRPAGRSGCRGQCCVLDRSRRPHAHDDGALRQRTPPVRQADRQLPGGEAPPGQRPRRARVRPARHLPRRLVARHRTADPVARRVDGQGDGIRRGRPRRPRRPPGARRHRLHLGVRPPLLLEARPGPCLGPGATPPPTAASCWRTPWRTDRQPPAGPRWLGSQRPCPNPASNRHDRVPRWPP